MQYLLISTACHPIIIPLTVVSIQHGDKDSEEAGHRHRRHQHTVRVEGIERQSTLPEMSKSLQLFIRYDSQLDIQVRVAIV